MSFDYIRYLEIVIGSILIIATIGELILLVLFGVFFSPYTLFISVPLAIFSVLITYHTLKEKN